MLVVNVGINSEKSLQNGFGYQHEILRKRNTYALKKKIEKSVDAFNYDFFESKFVDENNCKITNNHRIYPRISREILARIWPIFFQLDLNTGH